MTNDPNKKENQQNYTGGQPGQQGGQQHDKHQSGQQHNNQNESAQKRPTQGGTDVEQDQQKQDRTGQRKAS